MCHFISQYLSCSYHRTGLFSYILGIPPTLFELGKIYCEKSRIGNFGLINLQKLRNKRTASVDSLCIHINLFKYFQGKDQSL